MRECERKLEVWKKGANEEDEEGWRLEKLLLDWYS